MIFAKKYLLQWVRNKYCDTKKIEVDRVNESMFRKLLSIVKKINVASEWRKKGSFFFFSLLYTYLKRNTKSYLKFLKDWNSHRSFPSLQILNSFYQRFLGRFSESYDKLSREEFEYSNLFKEKLFLFSISMNGFLMNVTKIYYIYYTNFHTKIQRYKQR